MSQPLISLCIPTNGVIEWVFPVLDSIYSQNVDNELFEVVVTDNGNNAEFFTLMSEYAEKHNNLKYQKNNAYMFDNQLEALKLADGKYLKFVNHSAVFTDGSLNHLIKMLKENILEKHVIYFSCGALKKDIYKLSNFDDFVKTLGKLVSWTTGVGIWKEDYDKIPKNVKYDKISAHSCILFSERQKNKYIVDNYPFSKEIRTNHANKGSYDLFKAFAVEEVAIALNLYIDNSITAKTFKSVKKDYRKFVSDLYKNFCILRSPCSYNLKGFDDAMGIFFSKKQIVMEAYLSLCKSVLGKIKRVLLRRN